MTQTMTQRFAILGAGRIGQVHARAIANNPLAQLVAIFDPIADAANHIITTYGGRKASIDEIVADNSIDAVILCTPTDMHADQIELFARNGKAIFCEKPIDLDAERVKACLTVVNETNARLWLALTDALTPHFMALKEAIDAMAISVGNVHLQQDREGGIDEQRVHEIQAMTKVPLVIHGGSGVPEAQRRHLAQTTNICKFNIGTELRMAFGHALHHAIDADKERFDRVQILKETIDPVERATRRVLRCFKPAP